MTTAVIDTNVLLVANNSHQDVSPECVSTCVERLRDLMREGVVVIDSGWKIVGEYRKRTEPNQPKGVGDAFLKWILQNSANTRHVYQVSLTETADGCFAEFPDPDLQARFDASDRKFVAAAFAHPDRPAVWQAADCKWLDWWPELRAAGVGVEFICPQDVRRFYTAKFPNGPEPAMPEQ